MSSKNLQRGLSDESGVPVALIGETALISTVKQERRVDHRVRQTLEFAPASGDDVNVYFRSALELSVGEYADRLAKHAEGSFRRIKSDALKCERIMMASGLKKIEARLIEKVCG